MNHLVSLSRQIGRTTLAILLLICVAAGTSCRPEPGQLPLDPPTGSPAVTEPAASTPQAETLPDTEWIDTEEPASEPKEMEAPNAEKQAEEPAEEPSEPEPVDAEMTDEPPLTDPNDELDFGEPLVEGLGQNERLAPKQPVWLTKDRKSVVVQSMVCQRQAPLEMFACLLRSKEHESVLAVPVKAFVVHAGLLAAGAEQGTPVRWDPEYAPPTGTEIEITVLWKDEKGETQKARAQDWVRDMSTGKAMTQPWVFAGSKMYEDEETRKKYYMADSSGDLICVSNFSSATLDVPIRSSDANASLMFEAFTERIPPLGTPVTMVLTPKLEKAEEPEPADEQPSEEQKS